MIKFLILTSLLLTLNVGFSQSGYMGKKTFIEYNTFLSTALTNPNKNWEQGYTSYNVAHNIGINRVISRRSVLGFSYQIATTGFEVELVNPNFNYYNDSQQNFNVRYNLNVTTLSLDYKLFSDVKSVVAPLGVYWSFKLNYHTINFNDDLTKNDIAQTNSFELKIGTGVHKIIANKFILDLAMEVDASPWHWAYIIEDKDDVISGITSKEIEEDIIKAGKGRVNAMYYFGARVGIGYLF